MTENKAKKNLELLERCYRVSKKGSALHEVLIEFVTLEDLVEAIQALEKQIPKKMERYQCPECRHYFEDGEPHKYCPCCGQRLE